MTDDPIAAIGKLHAEATEGRPTPWEFGATLDGAEAEKYKENPEAYYAADLSDDTGCGLVCHRAWWTCEASVRKLLAAQANLWPALERYVRAQEEREAAWNELWVAVVDDLLDSDVDVSGAAKALERLVEARAALQRAVEEEVG